MAGELQMSTSGYGKIERGEIDLTLSKLFKISTVLGVSVTDVLFFDFNKFFPDKIEGPFSQIRILQKPDVSDATDQLDMGT